MTTSEHHPPPPRIWRGLGLAAVLLLLGSITVIGLISAGVFDPQPTGQFASRRSLNAQMIGAGETRLTWLSETMAADTFTVRLTAARSAGEQDVGYGAVVGTDGAYLAAAVSPLGYVAVWTEQDGQREMVIPWQPWLHVQRGPEPNEVQIDVTGERATVRVNRERLWEGETAIQVPAAGLVAQSFGEEATIDFQELVIFTPAATLTPETISR